MSKPIISVEEIAKSYRVGCVADRPTTFRDAVRGAMTAPLRRLRSLGEKTAQEETFWALDDVSFEVKQGEVVGVIGRNGAGKSTLLKILSRITEPTRGCARLRGRIASLLEVGTGFHPELSGRENIYLNGSILGMRKTEIDRKFDEIVAFAEIEKFLDTPVKHYSSGMYVRLAFAVAAHLEPEILIVDEVLAVGDVQFQKKCLGKMKEVSSGQGRTVLFVSHNTAAIRTLCQSGVLLEKGKLKLRASAEECIAAYVGAGTDSALCPSVDFNRPTGASPWMNRARVLCNGIEGGTFHMGDRLTLDVDFGADRAIQYPRLGFVLSSVDGTKLLCANNRFQPCQELNSPVREGRLTCELGVVPLCAGRYFLSLWMGDHAHDAHVAEQAISFEVSERDVWGHGKLPPKNAASMWWPTTFRVLQPEAREVHGSC
jgi:lipopolysaccharide transport system ATP-binding protein